MEEKWIPVQGYEGMYEVSNLGRVRSLTREVIQKNRYGQNTKHIYHGRLIAFDSTPSGYKQVDLHMNGKTRRFLVHRLVAIHFLDRPSGKDYINHIDNDVTNNTISNLEWCTQSENIQYAYEKGRKKAPHQRKVAQYDIDGNLIHIWESQSEAGRALNIHQSNIYKVCRGIRKQAGGYIWTYTE